MLTLTGVQLQALTHKIPHHLSLLQLKTLQRKQPAQTEQRFHLKKKEEEEEESWAPYG
jgi:hypothetical protein